jgi:hypothetical protein
MYEVEIAAPINFCGLRDANEEARFVLELSITNVSGYVHLAEFVRATNTTL